MGPTPPARRAIGSSAPSSAARSRPRCRSCALDGRTKLVDLIVAAGFAESKRAAQRLIAEGAVKVDGTPVTDAGARWTATGAAVLQVGSRKFVRVIP